VVNRLGLRTLKGKRVSGQTFGQMLRNPPYAGRLRVPRWDMQPARGAFEAIVSEELFERTQAVSEGPSADRHAPRAQQPGIPAPSVRAVWPVRRRSLGGRFSARSFSTCGKRSGRWPARDQNRAKGAGGTEGTEGAARGRVSLPAGDRPCDVPGREGPARPRDRARQDSRARGQTRRDGRRGRRRVRRARAHERGEALAGVLTRAKQRLQQLLFLGV
jgi:hypothetical protein